MAIRTLLFRFIVVLLGTTVTPFQQTPPLQIPPLQMPEIGNSFTPVHEGEFTPPFPDIGNNYMNHGEGNPHFHDWHETSDDGGSYVENGYGRKVGYHSNHEGSISEGNNDNNEDFSDISHDEPLS
ncbi:PREDICTED: uncharacterized protein LOC101308784 isoform 2 [Fragaria vesca subsp. vesca]